ncbi:MAG: solute carrier family 23 protein, partial [Cetobacterium sp.]
MEGINTKLERVMSEPVRTLLIYALQHIAAMCAGAIAVPIILGGALGLPQEEIQFLVNATLMVSGVGTMIQTLGIGKKFGSRLLMIEGVSFAGVAALTSVASAYNGVDPRLGISIMFGATMISGVFTMIFAPVVGKMLKFFPNLVSGTVVTCMGLSLLP